MTPSERAALVAQIAVQMHVSTSHRATDHDPKTGNAPRVERLTREAVAWLAAAEYAVMGEPDHAPARPEMCESCGGAEETDDLGVESDLRP